MRTLNETEMRAAAGGIQPLTRPEPDLTREDSELDKWRIIMQLRVPRIGDNS